MSASDDDLLGGFDNTQNSALGDDGGAPDRGGPRYESTFGMSLLKPAVVAGGNHNESLEGAADNGGDETDESFGQGYGMTFGAGPGAGINAADISAIAAEPNTPDARRTSAAHETEQVATLDEGEDGLLAPDDLADYKEKFKQVWAAEAKGYFAPEQRHDLLKSLPKMDV